MPWKAVSSGATLRERAPPKLHYSESVTELLRKAFNRVEAMPESDQDAFAYGIMEMVDEEEAWDRSLKSNPEKLVAMAEEALEEHRRGQTRPIEELLGSD